LRVVPRLLLGNGEGVTLVLAKMLGRFLVLLWADKFEAFSVPHGGSILYRLDVLFVEESDLIRVQIQKMSEFVADIGSDAIISTIFQPYLHQKLFLAETKTCSNHNWLFKLLTYINFSLLLNLPMRAKSIDSHILSRLSSLETFMIQMPPFGESYKEWLT
jgi:hypothetical protein